MIALVLALSLAGAPQAAPELRPPAARTSSASRPLTPREEAARRALIECAATVEHLAIDVAELERQRAYLDRRLRALADRPVTPPAAPPEPEAPEWVPWVVTGAAVVGAVLGAVGTIAVIEAVRP